MSWSSAYEAASEKPLASDEVLAYAEKVSFPEDPGIREDELVGVEGPSELISRRDGSTRISLLWDKACERLTVLVEDPVNEDTFMLPVAENKALDVFHHPHAYRQLGPVAVSAA